MAKKKKKSKSSSKATRSKKYTYKRATSQKNQVAYQYNINLTLAGANGSSYSINEQFVKYVLFDYDYEESIMPVIYVSFSATNEMYNAIMSQNNQKSGKIFFTLNKHNAYSNTALNTPAISGQFSYVPSTSNVNYTQELTENIATADNAYREITVGLISEELLDKSRTYKNAIYKEIDTNTLIGIALEGLNQDSTVIMKTPLYSVDLENEVIPPMANRKQLISYIFNQAPFYDTNFVFFLDFKRVYLIDKQGDGCEIADGTLHNVIFDISDVTNSNSYKEGIEVRSNEGAYVVHINPANANASLNRSQDRVANRVIVVSENGYQEDMDVHIDVNSTSESKDKFDFWRGSDAKLVKNEMESNTVFFTLQKPYINASVFTPNKRYMISNYGGSKSFMDYSDYNGAYTLAFKKEVIMNVGGVFNESSEFGMRKVGNITSIGGTAANNASNQSKSSNSYYINGTGNAANDTTTTTTTVASSSTPNTLANSTTPAPNSNIPVSAPEDPLLAQIQVIDNEPNTKEVKLESPPIDFDNLPDELKNIAVVDGENVSYRPIEDIKYYSHKRPLIDASGAKVIIRETPEHKDLMRKL